MRVGYPAKYDARGDHRSFPESPLFPLTIALAFIAGRQYRRREAFGKSFLLYGACIFLTVGTLLWALISENIAILGGLFLLTPLLGLLFYGLRRIWNAVPVRRAAGRSVWLNYLAVPGLWTTGFFAALLVAGSMLDAAFYEDPYYDDPYYEEYGYGEEIEEEDYFYYEGDSLLTTGLEGMSYPDSFPPASENGQAMSAASSTDEFSEAEAAPDIPADPDFADPAAEDAADASSPSLSNLRRLIAQLFDPEESIRDEARRQLADYWKDDRALIPELVQYSYDNPDMNEGIWNTLYLLEIQSDELMQNNSALLSDYL